MKESPYSLLPCVHRRRGRGEAVGGGNGRGGAGQEGGGGAAGGDKEGLHLSGVDLPPQTEEGQGVGLRCSWSRE